MASSAPRRKWLPLLLIALTVVTSNLGAVAINVATAVDEWPGPLEVIRQNPFGSSLSITVAMVVLAAFAWIRDQGSVTEDIAGRAEPKPVGLLRPGEHSRFFLRRVRRTRERLVKGILKGRYYFEPPIWDVANALAGLPVVTEYRFNEAVSRSDRARPLVGIGDQSAVEAFERSGSQLLVVGEAGAGKTHVLLAILKKALERASDDNDCPVPFYLNLADWRPNRDGFVEWLTLTVMADYGVSRSVFFYWLEQGDVMLALDGLDELRVGRRADCVKSLNQFRVSFGLLPIVVACRAREYRELSVAVNVRGTLALEGVRPSDVLDIVSDVDSTHRGLSEKVSRNKRLRDLLRSPLFLQLAIAAFGGEPAHRIRSINGKWATAIVDTYIRKAILRARGVSDIDAGNESWLLLIAARQKRNRETVFFLDRLPLQLADNETTPAIRRRAGLIAAAISFFGIFAVRAPTLGFSSRSEVIAPYLSTAWLLLLFVPYVAGSIARRAVVEPQAGRTLVVKKRLRRIVPRFLVLYALVGNLIWILNPLLLAFDIVAAGYMVLLIGVGLYPAVALMRSSEEGATSDLPRYPGEEMGSLWKACIGSMVTVLVCASASLFLILSPWEAGGLITPLASWAMLPYFVVPIAIVIGFINGGAELVSRYSARWTLARAGLLPAKYFESFDALRRSSILVPAGGGLSFIHALVRDHLARSAVVRQRRGPSRKARAQPTG